MGQRPPGRELGAGNSLDDLEPGRMNRLHLPAGREGREEFGLVWNVSLETGGVLISDKIKLVLDVQALKA